MTEQLIAELHALHKIDRDVLPRSVLLDRCVAVVQRDHLCLDGDVPTGDASVVEQPRMLEEHVDQLPEDVIGGSCASWMTVGSSLATAKACSASAAVPSPLIAIVNSPLWRASARNSATPCSGRPWLIPSAMSSGRAILESSVVPAGSLLGAIAGKARLPTMTGCMNSTAACAASVAAGPGAEGNQGPSAGEGAGHRMTGAGEVPGLSIEQSPHDVLALGDLLIERGASDRVAHAFGHSFIRSRWS